MNYFNISQEEVLNGHEVGGTKNIPLHHLISIMIGEESTPSICLEIELVGIERLLEYTIQEYMQDFDLTFEQGIRLYSAIQMARNVNGYKKVSGQRIFSPEKAADMMMEKVRFDKQEKIIVWMLDTKNHVIKEEVVFVGGLNCSLIHPREVFRKAIKVAAASIICFHNHPSGNPYASEEDMGVTKRLEEASELIGIELLDHIIIGGKEYYSFKEKGLLKEDDVYDKAI